MPYHADLLLSVISPCPFQFALSLYGPVRLCHQPPHHNEPDYATPGTKYRVQYGANADAGQANLRTFTATGFLPEVNHTNMGCPRSPLARSFPGSSGQGAVQAG